MEQTELCAALEEAIAASKAQYEKARDDAFLSHVYASKVETLEFLCRRAVRGLSAEEFAKEAQARIPRLQQLMQEEEAHPTFNWDNEHYYYLRYEGERDAWRAVQKLLEENRGRNS